MQLSSARVLITGATGSLGSQLARQLTAAGAAVLLVGRDEQRLADLQSELGASAAIVRADLNHSPDVALIADAARAFRVNVLINNAGVSGFGLLENQPWATVDGILATNLVAPIHLVQALLPVLRQQGAAAIVNIGSTFGSLPFAGFAAYSAAKAGLRGFSQALRRELADSAIRVIYLAPRAIDTPLNSPAVRQLNQALGSQTDAVDRVATQIIDALRAQQSECHFGFPERFFAWLNGVAPRLIDQALRSKLPLIKKYASGR